MRSRKNGIVERALGNLHASSVSNVQELLMMSTLDSRFRGTLQTLWIFTETVFCKYDTCAKCPHSFQTPGYSGRVISMKLHPQEVLATNAKSIVTELAMLEQKCNPLY